MHSTSSSGKRIITMPNSSTPTDDDADDCSPPLLHNSDDDSQASPGGGDELAIHIMMPDSSTPTCHHPLFLSDDDDDAAPTFIQNSDDDAEAKAEASPSDYSSCCHHDNDDDDDFHDLDRYCSANSALLSPSSCASRAGGDLDRYDNIPWIGGPAPSGSSYPSDSETDDGGSRDASAYFQHPYQVGYDADNDDGVLNPVTVPSATQNNRASHAYSSQEAINSTTVREEYHHHSEGQDDSLLDSGSDNEAGTVMRASASGMKYSGRECGNPLLISSSVAFGSGDWDEFLQENAVGDELETLSLFREQTDRQPNNLSDIKKGHSGPIDNHAGDPFLEEIDREEGEESVPKGSSCLEHVVDHSTDSVSVGVVGDLLRDYEVPPVEMPLVGHMVLNRGAMRETHSQLIEDVATVDVDGASVVLSSGQSEFRLPPLLSHNTLTSALQGEDNETHEDEKSTNLFSSLKDSEDPIIGGVVNKNVHLGNLDEDRFVLDEVKKPDIRESLDDMVLEMEEILLDSEKRSGSKFNQASRGLSTLQSSHLRDGGSTASTSGTDDAYPLPKHPPKVDWVEVVGAKQKKGDVSFGDRLVGVKEYTVYTIRVWSGKEQWEVERRYRDFYSLYRQLRNLFSDHGLSVPYPWSSVERESRKIFGNASPSVVSERSAIIQDSLRSILNTKIPSGAASSLACFLFPGEIVHHSSYIRSLIPRSLQKLEDENTGSLYFREISQEGVSTMGKTISLILELRPDKSMRQLLEEQHYTCAGCHTHLDAGRTLLREFVQAFGWNKPRLCEYTGQLFCASCHTNDTSVLPAKVLHLWDFSLCPVSQLAKAYLDSIYDQPMLCVSAVNPFLFSKVPALLHVMGVRKKIGAMIPYLQCPFRTSIQRGLGFRRYLLEANDFFALRDLFDLSKGAFAALPNMVENISSKIFEHITQQCLLCYDAGVPCAARQACNEPSSLIFPFQEDEATRCTSCGSIFHTPCFGKLMGCLCGKLRGADSTARSSQHVVNGEGKELDGVNGGSLQTHDTNSTSGFFTDLLSKAMPDRIWKPKKGNPVILMGSLPSTYL